ncbi:hypothetical protein ABMA27_011508 [Loxostege sticticalis]|uniref:Endonuclease/exonuclease/phosphatase domain-containing protein n=1 Tax=Loxostege sticticalis TaxID=481309 RepID=A0ABR3IGK1_LOXSC
MFTETWLISEIYDSEIADSEYTIYRRDRTSSIFNSKSDGGGVLIAVSRRFKSHRLCNFESSCDDVWVKLSLAVGNRTRDVYLCTVYLPSPINLSLLEHFIDNTNRVLEHIDSCVIIGDFNLNTISWLDDVGEPVITPQRTNSRLEQTLWDFILLNGMRQHNFLVNHNNRILDLVLTTIENVTVSEPLDVISKIDLHHPPLLVTLSFSQPINNQKSESRSKLNYFKADYDAINMALEAVDWKEKLEPCVSVDDMVSQFYTILHDLIIQHVPKVTVRSSRYPCWFSKSLIKRLNEKNRLRLKVKKYKNPMDVLALNLAKKRCDSLAVSCYNAYISDIESKISSNPKYFWSYLKMKRGGANNYPSEMTDGVGSSDNLDDIFKYFSSHFSKVYAGDLDERNNIEAVGIIDACLSNTILSQITLNQNQIGDALK